MRRAVAIPAVLAMLVWAAPGVIADPVEPAPAPVGGALADAPTLPLTDLGAAPAVSFYINHDVTITSVSFPVPPGLVPVALTVNIELPVSLRFGNLTVAQDGRTLSRLPLPPDDGAEMVIPIAGALASDNWVTLTMTMNAVPVEGYCWDPLAPVRLVNGAVTFAGTELPPTTVASFLPPVLRTVTIAVPATPSIAESNAAVQLAAAVADRRGQKPAVVVVPLPDGATTLPAPSAPFERQIIVKEGPDKGLSLQPGPGVPALLISGAGSDLAEQARLLAADSLKYALSPTAVADSLPQRQFVEDTTTLAQLTGSGLTPEAMWPQLAVQLDQTRWGHPLGGISVHLIGSYTPLPTSFGGEVLVSVGNENLARWPVDSAGIIDRTVDIPDRLLRRFTNLEVSVRTTGDPGNCGDRIPILLRVDGSSPITLQTSDPPTPQGFQSLPQALMPRVRVGIGPDTFGDTVRAAQIAVGLQHASGVPLTTEVTTLQQAMEGAGPAILVSSDGWTNNAIALPFSADKGKVNVTGLDGEDQSVTLTLDPATGFGSLQTVFDGERTFLIATSTGVPGQLDELLRYLAEQPGRWAGLDGRAIISTPGAAPVTVPNPSTNFSAQADLSSSSDGQGWFWWVAGGVAVVAGLGALAILLRARKTTAGGE